MGLAGLMAFGLSHAAVNFSFPQMSGYDGNATLLSDKAAASEQLKGMLLMVYFSDNTMSCQSQFDKLWNFYKKFENENGLMIWKIGNLSESWDAGNGAALDGDIDATAALVMAYYQTADGSYMKKNPP